MKNYILILAISLIASCAHQTKINYERMPQSTDELVNQVPKINEDILNPDIFNEKSCSTYIYKLTDYLYKLPSNYYYPKTENDKSFLLESGPETYKNLLMLKINLQARFSALKSPAPDCIKAVRRGIRITRYVADGLSEWMYYQGKFKSNIETFSEIHQQTFIHPEFINEVENDKFNLKTGDVILMRGQSFVSSMIARIGDEDANFSHLGIVGEDETGKKYLVEALIETGTILTPLDEWLKKEEARLVVYRNQNENLALNAGKKIVQYVKERLKKDGVIPYDFGMNTKSHDELFCSEVVQVAYELGSNNTISLPMYKTTFFELKDESFVKDMGIKQLETFAPYDIEMDPRFTAVAEYRHLKLLRKLKLHDASMSALFNWMIEKDYDFSANPKAFLMSKSAWILRQLGLLKSKMQKSMPAGAVATVVKFNDLTKIVYPYLFDLEEKYFNEHGFAPTYRELLTAMEEFRKADCIKFNQLSQKSYEENAPQAEINKTMHSVFRSRYLKCE